MITIVPSNQRHYSDIGWLQSYWHFSFSDYHDPSNMQWGKLRVFNDDIIQGGGGFGMHPHRDMEIITYVVDGELEHQDRLGNRGTVLPGEVQVMSAGRGITHSEFNHSKDKPVHLMQLWITPRKAGNTPRWEQKRFSPQQRDGKLLPVVSSGTVEGTLAIDQDATIYVSHLNTGEKVSHEAGSGRHGYLFVIDGTITVNGQKLSRGDQARIKDEAHLEIVGATDAELIFLDLP